MNNPSERAIAVVALGAILPDAQSPKMFWENILGRRYSIREVPSSRWDPGLYYDPDPMAPDKTYSKIGGWVEGFDFNWKSLRIPPKVTAAMDEGQKWALAITAQALENYGYPERSLDLERTAVVFGTAMGGEMHYLTALRISFPEIAQALVNVAPFSGLPVETRRAILSNWETAIGELYPPVTEDSMPGELANIVSGRVANVFNFRGPNFITDAACAASFAAVEAAISLLNERKADAVLTGGVDHNMGASSFVKFCKIGALSAHGSRPFGQGADGFVMGEGAAAFLLKRLADAERDGDQIYAVIRGICGASDGKGKGIYAPNPVGQQLAMQRAWQVAGLDPATATLVEAHGTSTRVGDVVEVESLAKVFCAAPSKSIALGSVKSNIGHLKGGAGAAGLLKTILALHNKIIPPTLNADPPNPDIDFRRTPFDLAIEAREWLGNGTPRRAGVSAYGFGGTNFHAVLEEYIPGLLAPTGNSYQGASVSGNSQSSSTKEPAETRPSTGKTPVRGILALGADSPVELKDQLDKELRKTRQSGAPPIQAPNSKTLMAHERLVIDYGNTEELLDRLEKARRALESESLPVWKALQAQGIFRGNGSPPGKIAFLFPGQGSQYTNMGLELRKLDPLVAEVFADGDRVMAPVLGKPLSSFIFNNSRDPAEMQAAELNLMQTEICQPAMLTMDTALFKLLGDYGFNPSMVMGHSLGEYAALIAAGVMPFEDALEAVAARGREMAAFHQGIEDNGWMAAVMAPLAVIQETLAGINGYVVTANINSYNQCVIGGASKAVEQAIQAFQEAGYEARRIPVSHAFHTKIVAPASGPLRQVLNRLRVYPPQIPIIANVTGEIYPQTPDEIRDLLEQQVASPVQWVKGLETLYSAGVRVFVEVGPKKALKGLVDDVLGNKPDLVSLFTNHPKIGELATFNQALCGLYAAGFGSRLQDEISKNGMGIAVRSRSIEDKRDAAMNQDTQQEMKGVGLSMERPDKSQGFAENRPTADQVEPGNGKFSSAPALPTDVAALGQLLVDAIRGNGQKSQTETSSLPYDRNTVPLGSVVITGTGLGLPGAEKRVMDPDNVQRILRGEGFIDLIPERFRQKVLGKRITRVVKSEDGSGRLELIQSSDEVIRLAGRPGAFDLVEEYGVPEKLVEALDATTQLAMAAGLDALREAGIPLVLTYRQTTTGKYLPDRWILPEALRDETGVIFASAFPGGDRLADEFSRFYTFQNRVEQLQFLEDLRLKTQDVDTLQEILCRIHTLREDLQREPYEFDRRFIFRILAMGHSQFAEFIGARGPNTHVNAACASTTQAITLAEDWIRSGRCRRVIVIAADNATGDHLLEWVGAGLLATGAVATDDSVEEAALPFDRRRHGTIMGMGACALVLESENAVQERGMRGITELLSSEMSNSAFHGTRLDVDHIAYVMDNLLSAAERRFGLQRHVIASQTVFISHETFTPARGGSASAEVFAIRKNFGPAADELVISNTKGLTGHPMGVGIEDVIAVKILEHGVVPPVANHREHDPKLGDLNLSQGGRYPVKFALHLAAGFGSQVAMVLLRRIPGKLDRLDQPARYQYWLSQVSGYDRAETEVFKRTLRVKDQGNPARAPAPSSWQYGTGPSVRAVEYGVDGRQVMQFAMPEDGKERRAEEDTGRRRLDGEKRTIDDGTPAAENVQQQKTGWQPEPAQPSGVYPPLDEKISLKDEPLAAIEQPASIVQDQPSPSDPVAEKILGIVAEKTGYPQDMLELDLDLEADLGIDTVKQAETFLALREAFDIPKQENLKLRDYPTLAHVIGFVKGMRPDLAVHTQDDPQKTMAESLDKMLESPIEQPSPFMVQPSSESDPVALRVLAIVAEKTGYPEDMLELDLDLEADLGIDTVKQAETFLALREAFDIPRQENLKLRDYPTLGHVIGFVKEMRPDLAVVHPTSPSNPSDPITAKVLAIVAEKTGYPQDMLELDLDLEADLGIDTVKQAETFLALREAFNIPRQENLKLRDYPTLGHVIGFVKQLRPDLAGEIDDEVQKTKKDDILQTMAGDQKQEIEPLGERLTSSTVHPSYSLEAADRFPRRVPLPVLRPTLELCKPSGIQLTGGTRIIIAQDSGGAGEALAKRLAKHGVKILRLDSSMEPEVLDAQLSGWLAEGPVQGVYWLPALDVEPGLENLEIDDWKAFNRQYVKNLFLTMRALACSNHSQTAFLVAGTRLGGLHGYGPVKGTGSILAGGVTGFTKSYRQEMPGILVKAVDFETDRKPAKVAEALIAETLRDPDLVEVGYWQDSRFGITLAEQPAADGNPGLSLGPETVFLVTGAAGGITSAIITDLAAASGGCFYLLDLAPLPDAKDRHIQLFRQDREVLKASLIETAKAAGERTTPAQIEKELQRIERQEAALRAVETVQAAGGLAYYQSVDLLDSVAVAQVIEEVRQRYGRIDVLIHAAGVEISRSLADKDPVQFDLVYGVKTEGLYNLLYSAKDLPIGAIICFSSVAGRFGNAGQTDYSAANDLLCKLVSSLPGWRPATRGLAIDWTAWAGIGMATRGSIPKVMEYAGIETLPPEVGIPTIRRELVAGSRRGEVVVAGQLGVLMKEPDATGGLDTEKASAWTVGREPPLALVGSVRAAHQTGEFEAELELDPKAQPFLFDHAMGGVPLLPGVMGTEAFAELATHVAPGYRVIALENESFERAFKFFNMEPQRLYFSMKIHPVADGELLAEVMIRSRRALVGQGGEIQEKIHFRANVRLGRDLPARSNIYLPGVPENWQEVTANEIYRLYFHGPAFQVLESVYLHGDQALGILNPSLPSLIHPAGTTTLMAPRLIELCLQTVGVWEMKTKGQLALPSKITSVRVWGEPEGSGETRSQLMAIIKASEEGEHFDAHVIDDQGQVYVELKGYKTVPLPIGVPLGG